MRHSIKVFLIALLLGACGPEPLILPKNPIGGIAAIPTRDHPTCVVTRVVDGDTIEIRCQDQKGNVRLTGFDTPETHRPGCAAEARLGERAKQFLEDQLREARLIAPKFEGTGKYGRALVRLTVDGVPLSEIMIDAGLAVSYAGGRRIDWCRRLGT